MGWDLRLDVLIKLLDHLPWLPSDANVDERRRAIVRHERLHARLSHQEEEQVARLALRLGQTTPEPHALGDEQQRVEDRLHLGHAGQRLRVLDEARQLAQRRRLGEIAAQLDLDEAGTAEALLKERLGAPRLGVAAEEGPRLHPHIEIPGQGERSREQDQPDERDERRVALRPGPGALERTTKPRELLPWRRAARPQHEHRRHQRQRRRPDEPDADAAGDAEGAHRRDAHHDEGEEADRGRRGIDRQRHGHRRHRVAHRLFGRLGLADEVVAPEQVDREGAPGGEEDHGKGRRRNGEAIADRAHRAEHRERGEADAADRQPHADPVAERQHDDEEEQEDRDGREAQHVAAGLAVDRVAGERRAPVVELEAGERRRCGGAQRANDAGRADARREVDHEQRGAPVGGDELADDARARQHLGAQRRLGRAIGGWAGDERGDLDAERRRQQVLDRGERQDAIDSLGVAHRLGGTREATDRLAGEDVLAGRRLHPDERDPQRTEALRHLEEALHIWIALGKKHEEILLVAQADDPDQRSRHEEEVHEHDEPRPAYRERRQLLDGPVSTPAYLHTHRIPRLRAGVPRSAVTTCAGWDAPPQRLSAGSTRGTARASCRRRWPCRAVGCRGGTSRRSRAASSTGR